MDPAFEKQKLSRKKTTNPLFWIVLGGGSSSSSPHLHTVEASKQVVEDNDVTVDGQEGQETCD